MIKCVIYADTVLFTAIQYLNTVPKFGSYCKSDQQSSQWHLLEPCLFYLQRSDIRW